MNKFKMIAAALASTVAFASPVFAGWTKAATGTAIGVNSGDTYYIDFDTVKENNGYVHYWELVNYLKPTESGKLSAKALNEVDCDIPRKYRHLSFVFYKQPMGGGNGDDFKNPSDEWWYPTPDMPDETMTNAACDYAGK